jgi:serine/threonine-protein kinase
MNPVLCPACGQPNSEFNLRCSACDALLSQDGALTAVGRADAAPVPEGLRRPDAFSGRRYAGYRALEPLGQGGYGVVYRALELHTGQTMALKFLAPELARDPRARARFVREARATIALRHPNVGTVHQIGEQDGQLYIAMDLYEGETLQRCIARGRLAPDEAGAIAAQIAAGLGAAHDAGIVHRDLKPANVMLTAAGQVKLLDFGLAKLLAASGAETPLTGNGEMLGTLAYMAPEQLLGCPAGAAADLYALGVILYERRYATAAALIAALEPLLPAAPS